MYIHDNPLFASVTILKVSNLMLNVNCGDVATMIFSQQLRAGRNLLDWSQETLALNSGVGIATIKRIEAKSGPATGQAETIWKLQTTMEAAGIIFIANDAIHGPGVRLREPYSRD